MLICIDPASTSPDTNAELLLADIRLRRQPDAAVWSLPLPLLTDPACQERWVVADQVQTSSVSATGWQLQHRYNQHLACTWLRFEVPTNGDYGERMRWAYTEMLGHLRNSNHQQLLKIWHYLPEINTGAGDAEHYRHFCLGREQALTQLAVPRPMPAATAIGIPADPEQQTSGSVAAVFYWLSSTLAPVNIENPRQTSAWEYPIQYGPASPNFSRASRLDLDARNSLLLLSGTASVTGHATAYPDDCAAQTDEMLLNLHSLVTAAGMPYHPEKLCLRIYLRRPADWPLVLGKMQAAGFRQQQLQALHGDICRRDLLVELDGFTRQARL